jgi:gluconokinase
MTRSAGGRWGRGDVQLEQGRAIIVMGVSGSGKSTLAALLAQMLDCPFLEGDAFHSAANVAKMRGGEPLTDGDRGPWLDTLGHALGDAARTHGTAVAACSALKRAYRDRLRAAAAMPIRFVFLAGTRPELLRRLRERPHHYMPASLLESQLATLERPGVEEGALTLDGGPSPAVLACDVMAWLAQPAAAAVDRAARA